MGHMEGIAGIWQQNKFCDRPPAADRLVRLNHVTERSHLSAVGQPIYSYRVITALQYIPVQKRIPVEAGGSRG